MSNLPPGFTEPREHDERCELVCDWGSSTDEDGPCPFHRDHDCTCADIAQTRAENEAASLWEQAAFDAWDRQQP